MGLLSLTFAVLAAVLQTSSAVRATRHEATDLEDEGFQPVCSPWVVQETCKLLGGSRSGAFDDISMIELQEALAGNEKSIKVFWYLLGLPQNRSTATGSPEIKCSALCEAVVNRLKTFMAVPPTSDAACYKEGNLTKCDLDLRPKQVRKLVTMGSELPDFHDEAVLGEVSRMSWDRLVRELEASKEGTAPALTVQPRPTTIHYPPLQVALRVTNLFRIYPTASIAFAEGISPENSTDPLLADISSSLVEAAGAGGDDSGLGTENCKFWCGDTPDCLHSSCRGCGQCSKGKPAISAATSAVELHANSTWSCDVRYCRSERDCAPSAYFCRDCAFCRSVGASWTPPQRPVWPPQPQQPLPGTYVGAAGQGVMSVWQTNVQKINAKAQVYVTTAIRKFKMRQTQGNLQKWFGAAVATDPDFQKEVNRVVNSVADMLSNVEYVFPGAQCKPNTYAYVYPHGDGARNSEGKYIFHLCQLYMDSEESVQVETLTHEGSHHATAYTDDVCVDEFHGGAPPRYFEMDIAAFPANVAVDQAYLISGAQATVKFIKGSVVVLDSQASQDCKNVAYGREECKSLARKDSVKALRNADNICYYLQDVTDSPM